MSRLIYADALIEDLKKYFIENKIHKNDLAEVIARQPKVNEWIPVEERLPEEEGTYLCYEVCGNYPCYGVLNFAKNLHKVDKYDFQNEKRPGFYHLDSEYGYLEDTNVVAWMPLPAPYDMWKKVEE